MYEFMADRYTRADAQYGRIPGFVVGNELQSHWVWHNIGETPAEEVIEDYVRAVRIAWLAARSQHKDLRVFISMDHSWTHTVLDDPLKVIPGDELLRGFAKEAKRGGDFPWHVAFHPYPENLFEPRFWNDRTALMRFDTPRITFKNLEVLPEFLRQEEFLYNGELRGIALTEQGFHTPDAPDGEAVQAAAYCYAFHKVNHMPEIDAFIYHRHTSMPDEGGLDLGLWMWDPEALPEIRPGKKKRIWEVYKAAGTPDWEEAFAFALPLIGIDSWDEALPDYAIDTTPAPEMDRDRVVADLIKLKEKAVVQNSESWRTEVVVKSAGWAAKSIFQHPPEEGAGTAAFPIDLPEAEGDKLLMQFDTLLAGPSENGVEFSVRVNGAEVWRTHQTKEPSVPHEIDLTPYAGQTIELTLAVDAMGNTSYDWAHWVQPTIIRAE
jgi:hypothetical protein